MPTRANTEHPFSNPEAPSKARFEAYLAGRLSPQEKHAFERGMELDPMLREAVEGLRGPEALEGMASLDTLRPTGAATRGSGWRYLLGAMVVVITAAGTWYALSQTPEDQNAMVAVGAHADTVVREVAEVNTTALDHTMIEAAVEQPETLLIGHTAEERPMPSVPDNPPVLRDPGLVPLEPIRPAIANDPPTVPRPSRAARSTRMLIFPHDLKLVHPDELYPYEPGVDPSVLSVSAQYTDRRSQQAGSEKERTMRYTDHMDQALGHFSRNDHKACLKMMDFLLEQYPEDVNALFYAGLCSYNLGLYDHARGFLHRAATHPVDSFNEEATWYHALTLERLGERQAAQEAFARIVADGGFYAKRAAERSR
jgi:hypothetical protein